MFSLRRQHRSFPHGIHPPEAKDDTRDLSIKQFPFAPVMIVPLQQHIGKAALAVVREGQEVERGQLIAEPDGFLSVAMHAPASGVIQRIGLAGDRLAQHELHDHKDRQDEHQNQKQCGHRIDKAGPDCP